MLKKHTTAQGKTLLVCQMDDKHLSNTIKLICNDIIKVKNQALQIDELSEFDKAMLRVEQITPETAGRLARNLIDRLYPYLAEAYLRDLNLDTRQAVTEAIGREHAMQAGQVPMLSEGTIYEPGEF